MRLSPRTALAVVTHRRGCTHPIPRCGNITFLNYGSWQKKKKLGVPARFLLVGAIQYERHHIRMKLPKNIVIFLQAFQLN